MRAKVRKIIVLGAMGELWEIQRCTESGSRCQSRKKNSTFAAKI